MRISVNDVFRCNLCCENAPQEVSEASYKLQATTFLNVDFNGKEYYSEALILYFCYCKGNPPMKEVVFFSARL